MTTAVSFEGIRYVRSDLFNTTALTPLRETHHKGGILGTVLGVVAAIVVPFVAPMIAGTLFAGSTLLSGTVGSALVGSALGAGASALTGGNALTGALMGGLGGGLAGFSQTGTLFGEAAAAPATGSTLTAGQVAASSPTATGVVGAAAEASGLPVVGSDIASGLSGSLAGAATPAPAPSQSISQTLSNATGNLVSPDTVGKLGQAAIGAGVQAIPGMLAANEASAASAAQADLAQAQAAVFKNQLSIAEQLKQGALAVDPQYLGQRAQAGVFKNLAAQQREMAGQEAIRGGESQAAFDAAELRRGQIYGTEAAITAGDNARLAGLSTQNQMLRGASAAYPTPPSGYANYLERSAGNAAEGYGNIAGAFAYPFLTDYMRSFYNSQKNPNAVG